MRLRVGNDDFISRATRGCAWRRKANFEFDFASYPPTENSVSNHIAAVTEAYAVELVWIAQLTTSASAAELER